MKKFSALCLAILMVLGAVGASAMTAGTYEAAAQGFHGDVKLAVTADAEKITAIEVIEHSETEGIGAAEAGGGRAGESDARRRFHRWRNGDLERVQGGDDRRP